MLHFGLFKHNLPYYHSTVMVLNNVTMIWEHLGVLGFHFYWFLMGKITFSFFLICA